MKIPLLLMLAHILTCALIGWYLSDFIRFLAEWMYNV